MNFRYMTEGTCCQAFDITVEDGILKDVVFYGGCSGNTQGVGALVKGMKVNDVIARLEGIKCGAKNTSCPDQLAKALRSMPAAVK